MQAKSDKTTELTINTSRRFGGIASLYGDVGLAQLQQAHVCVIGIGGVGSWAVESLARSAVGEITMIDMDIVAESNINRQILADTTSIGRDKIAVMRERVNNINPVCKTNLVDEFITAENVANLITSDMDYVIDCIDDFRKKAALIAHCKRKKIKIITVGGAGGQIDPTKIRQTDLSNTEHDKLLSTTRKLLRQDYGFPKNLKRTFGVPCVFSDEQSRYPDGHGETTYERPFVRFTQDKPASAPAPDEGGQSESRLPENRESEVHQSETDQSMNEDLTSQPALSCAGGIGSITHVTASFAFYATAFVLKALAASQAAN